MPWYDLPEMQAANDALWFAIAAELRASHLREIRPRLDRKSSAGDGDAWLFTQTCGYPLLRTARDRFTVLAAPVYAVPGCEGSLHRSFIVTRDDARASSLEDVRATIFAINETDSNTGMNLARRLFAPLARDGRFFARTIITGSHAASAELVSAGRADAAAIDCVTFAFLQRYRPAAVHRLRVLAETQTAPAPPFVTSRSSSGTLVEALRRALLAVVREASYADIRDRLFLMDIDVCDADAYTGILEYESDAQRLGYPELR